MSPHWFGTTHEADWVALNSCVEGLEGGVSPATEGRPATAAERGVLKFGAVSFGRFDDSQHKALPADFAVAADLEVRAGDLLMSRANTLDLVGACAFVERTRPGLYLSDKTWRFVFRKGQVVRPQYLAERLKSPAVRQQIEAAASGTSPTMKNISKESVLNLRIPPHSLDEQHEIEERCDRLDAAMRELHACQLERDAALGPALAPAILDRAFAGRL